MSPEGEEAIARPRDDAPRRGAVDEAGVVRVALPCQTCGYDLRGLTATGACPECGTPIATSLRGDLLRDANPVWLRRVALGFRVFVNWIIVAIVVSFVESLVLGMLARTGSTIVEAIGWLILLGLVVPVLVAHWLITTPEPARSLDRARVVARWGLISWAVAGVGLGLAAESVTSGTGALGVMLVSLNVVVNFVGAACTVALFVYVRGLARRVPDPLLARRAMIVMWGLPISIAVVLLHGLIVQVAGPVPGHVLVAAPAHMAFGVFAIWSVVLAFACHNRLTAAADHAAAASA